ncbi:hypothetical protein [Lysinibacillus xylanilyticus]|uniref:hypothetical protein n=1 Tax=Lysinibacillus xylanilyticus TaxID=582475 RepID=UPI003CFE3842
MSKLDINIQLFIDENNDSDIWEKYKFIENECNNIRYLLMKHKDMQNILKKAFDSPHECTMALRFLQYFTHPDELKIIENLMPELVDIAIYGNPTNITYSRKVIGLVNRKWLEENIESYIEQIPISEPDDEEWKYRRVAELYVQLGFEKLLNSHLSFCSNHHSLEIKEIAEDYGFSI